MKCPEKVYSTTKKPYPEGKFVQCLQCFESPGCSSSHINIYTCSNQKYWDQHTNGTTQKMVGQTNDHNEEHMKIGKTKRQRQYIIHAFSVVMKHRKIQDDSDNTESVDDNDKKNFCIPINKKTNCVGFLN